METPWSLLIVIYIIIPVAALRLDLTSPGNTYMDVTLTLSILQYLP